MMDYDKFFDGIEEIFAAFGKNMPDDKIVQAIHKRVKNLPDDFMTYAVKFFENEEKLPRNIGRYLLLELWPEYLKQHPEMKAAEKYFSCPDCIPGIPGYRKAWAPALVLGKPGFECRIIRCQCKNAPNPYNEPIFTDNQLLDMGWRLDNPFIGQYPSKPFQWRNAIGHVEEVREAHKSCLEEMNGDDYEEIGQNRAQWPF